MKADAYYSGQLADGTMVLTPEFKRDIDRFYTDQRRGAVAEERQMKTRASMGLAYDAAPSDELRQLREERIGGKMMDAFRDAGATSGEIAAGESILRRVLGKRWLLDGGDTLQDEVGPAITLPAQMASSDSDWVTCFNGKTYQEGMKLWTQSQKKAA